jgi:hypothetical protein
MRFVSRTGYLPMTKEAFGERMAGEIETVGNAAVKMLLEAAMRMYEEYDFFIVAPNMDRLAALSGAYETDVKQAMRNGWQRVLNDEDANLVSEEIFAVYTDQHNHL